MKQAEHGQLSTKQNDRERIRDFNARYWAETNSLCRTCSYACKQSHLATLIHCSRYEQKRDLPR